MLCGTAAPKQLNHCFCAGFITLLLVWKCVEYYHDKYAKTMCKTVLKQCQILEPGYCIYWILY